MALHSNERLHEVLSLALEDRSKGYADLVSNNNAILHLIKKKGNWKKFSGPTIRERLLYNESGTYTRYSGYQLLNPRPAELINDAEFTPKLGAVTVTLSGEDILRNSGKNQLLDIMETHIEAAEQELQDRFVEDIHGDGTADGGKQITGLQAAIPVVNNAGVYGGIDRAVHAIWRPGSYRVAQDPFGLGTTLDETNIREFFSNIIINHSRGTRSPDCINAGKDHYIAYEKSVQEIQRITDDKGGLGSRGFQSLKYYGGGKSIDVVLDAGIGGSQADDQSYFLDMMALKFRYHPDRNFVKFGGKQMPVNQDAIVQHIGFYGNLTLNNPLFTASLKG